MKTIRLLRSLVLAGLIGALGFQAAPRTRSQIGPCVFFIGCGVICTCIIIYVYHQTPEPCVPHKMVLWRKALDNPADHWVALATNWWVFSSTNRAPVFSDTFRDTNHFLYRVERIETNPNEWPLGPNGDYKKWVNRTAYITR